jgi:hypothetical protein
VHFVGQRMPLEKPLRLRHEDEARVERQLDAEAEERKDAAEDLALVTCGGRANQPGTVAQAQVFVPVDVCPSSAGYERQVLGGVLPIQNVESVLHFVGQRMPTNPGQSHKRRFLFQ